MMHSARLITTMVRHGATPVDVDTPLNRNQLIRIIGDWDVISDDLVRTENIMPNSALDCMKRN